MYILSLLFIKKQSRWCFGSWFGERFADNTKFLYEIAENDHSIDAYWVTNNQKVYNSLKSENRKVVLAFSLKGIFIQLTSYVFICTVNSKDFYFPCITRRNMFIQTWHGAPLKKIGFDIDYNIIKRGINKLRYFLIDNYDYVISPDEKFDNSFMTAMNIDKSKIIRSDYPRCDSLKISENLTQNIKDKLQIETNEIFVFYVPTHRNEGMDVSQILSIYENFVSSNQLLKEHNIKVIIKLHPYDIKHSHLFKNDCTNVKMYNDDNEYDLYQVLAASDALITDYSSVMFEYELLNRCIYYFVPDLKEYSANLRGLYQSYQSLIENPIFNFEDLLCELLRNENNSSSKSCNASLEIEVGNISYHLLEKLKSKVISG